MKDSSSQSMRLARFLAACGLGSRRSCEDTITAGQVTVNGDRITDLATVVDLHDDVVCLKGRRVRPNTPVYLLLNKPPGYTCSARDDHAQHLVFELIPKRFGRLFSVGRLDRDSEGLLLLTNDGAFAQKVGHPSGGIRKTYDVWVDGTMTSESASRLRQGIRDQGELLKPVALTVRKRRGRKAVLRFVLLEGRKREIRRLCKHVGMSVSRLRRIALGKLRLGHLEPGQWRMLTDAEVSSLLGQD